MQNNSFNQVRQYQETDRINEQIKALNVRITALQDQVRQQDAKLQTAVQVAQQTQGVTNLMNNTDFSYSEAGFYGWSWLGASDTLSQWYRMQASATVQLDENDSAAVSSTTSQLTLTSTPSLWDRDKGLIILRVDDAILAPLPKNYALPGIPLYIRFSARSSGGTLDSIRFRASIWENTASPKIGETNAYPALTTALSPSASAGAFTRQYVLVSVDGQQRQISSPIASQSIDVSAVSVNNLKYVEISWTRQQDAVQYILYRTEDGVNWFQIAVTPGGVTSFRDLGGVNNIVPAPTPSSKASVSIVSVPAQVRDTQFTDFTVRLKVPAFYAYLSTGKQWLRIDNVDEFGNPVSLGANEVQIDRVLLATSLGKWTPSAADATAVSNIETPSPDPVDEYGLQQDPYSGYNGYYGY
jgi:hypothetical protein